MDLDNHFKFVSLFCIECKNKYEELKIKNCLDCGVKIEKYQSFCHTCRKIRIEKARKEGRCTLCFVGTQSDEIDKSGQKTDFCNHCLEAWTQMCLTSRLNDKINKR